jgi:hypothetical protein
MESFEHVGDSRRRGTVTCSSSGVLASFEDGRVGGASETAATPHGLDREPQHGAGGAPTDDTILGIITDTRTGNDAIGPHNPRCLPQCEDVGLDAGGEECELECAVGDRAALAN